MFSSLDIIDYFWLFILLSFLAEIIGTVGGFGSSVLFVPIAGMFLDFHTVLGVTAVFHLSSNISKITVFRQAFDRRLAILIGLPAIFFVAAGAYLSKFLEEKLIGIILAFFLIVLSIILLIWKHTSLRPTNINAVTGGALSGLVAGLIGTGGAIRGLTLAAFKLDKEIFIITSAVIDLGIDLTRSGVYWSNGFIHRHDLYLIVTLVLVGFIGTWVGKKIVNHLSEKQFRSFALLLILAIGVFTLYREIKHN